MRLLFINTYDPHPEKHGGATVTRAELAALASSYEVDTLFGMPIRLRWKRISYPRLLSDLLHLRSLKYSSYNVLHRPPSFYGTYDVIWCNHDFSAYDHMVFQRLGIPYVVRKHNAEHRLIEARRPLYRYERNRILSFERAACGRAIATCHISSTEWADDDYSKRKILLPPLLGTKPRLSTAYRFPYTFAARNIPLLCVANFTWPPNHQGIQWFISKVLPLLPSDISLHLVGVGSERYSRPTRVYGHGFVESLEPYYRSSRLFVSPVLSGAGIKVKNVSALAAGLPLISTPRGAEGLNGTNDPSLIRIANTPHEFAQHIGSLLGDERSCRLMSEASDAWARANVIDSLQWINTVDQLLREIVL